MYCSGVRADHLNVGERTMAVEALLLLVVLFLVLSYGFFRISNR
jgi:hypothetical protein